MWHGHEFDLHREGVWCPGLGNRPLDPRVDNQKRIVDAGLSDLVNPIHAEAHTLPFAEGFFDAIVCLDAYQYFGTADLYIGYLLDFLKPGSQLGAVMPGLSTEIGAEIPETLVPFWEWDFCSWHSPEWWRHHWAKTGKVTVDHANLIEDGWRDWLRFNDFIAPAVEGWWVKEVATTHDMLEQTVASTSDLRGSRLRRTDAPGCGRCFVH